MLDVNVLYVLVTHVQVELHMEEQTAVVQKVLYAQMELLIQVIIQDVNALIIHAQIIHVLSE